MGSGKGRTRRARSGASGETTAEVLVSHDDAVVVSYPTSGKLTPSGKPAPLLGVTAATAGVEAGQRYVADNMAKPIPDAPGTFYSTSPLYPYGSDDVIVEMISAAGEETEFGVEPRETAWCRSDENGKVQGISVYSLLLFFTRSSSA